MGKSKPFIDRSTARHFHLLDRRPAPADGEAEDDSDEDDEWEYEQGLKDELADLSVADRAGGGGDGGGDDESAPRPEEIDEFGFSRDGYDYSKHLRESGGGMWVPASAPGERAAPAPSAGGEFVLRDERESAAQAERARLTVAGAEITRVDLDLGELDDDILAALEMPGVRLVHGAGAHADGGAEGEPMPQLEGTGTTRGLGDLPDNFVEVVYRKGLRGRRRGKGKNRRASDEQEEGEEEEDEEEDARERARARNDDEAGSRFGGSRFGGSSRYGGSQSGRRDPANNTFLEQQLSAVLNHYDDEEIGELDEEDARVRGGSDLSAFDALLEEHLREHVEIPTLRSLYDASGSVGAGPRTEAREAAAFAAGGNVEGGLDPRHASRGLDRPVPLSAQARERLALVPEEAAEDDFDEHPFLKGLAADESADAQERWDCDTIVTTYSNTENHPALVRVRQKAPEQLIRLGPRGLPIGVHALPGVKLAAAKQTKAHVAAAADGGEASSDDDDDDDDDRLSTCTGVSAAVRQRGETSDEKRLRKVAVKADRRMRREEKKQTKELFSKERSKQLHVVARAQPTGLQI